MTAPLGCGTWTAAIMCRGGGEIELLPFSSLRLGRRLDDMSDASLTLLQTKLHSFAPAEQARCCGLLNTIEPWEHELGLWRDGEPTNSDPAWCGPITKLTWGIDHLVITARDLFQWFERRLLERDHTFTGVDLATIFKTYAVDAMHRDPSPHPDLSMITPTGITGDRAVLARAGRRAADEMRELARSGLDFTMIGRTMVAGGTVIPTADLGILGTDDFDDHELSVDGLQTETEAVVIGAPLNVIGGTVRAAAGGIDADRGLVQGADTESTILDVASAQALADSRLALLGTTPTFFKGRLLPTAPVGFEQLIPGATVDLRVQVMCRDVIGDHRLMDVDVSVNDKGEEDVLVTFSSIGTLAET